MGNSLLPEQVEIAKEVCPDVLRRLEELKYDLATNRRTRRGGQEKRIELDSSDEEWVLAARREITTELMIEWSIQARVFLNSLEAELCHS